MKKINKTMKYYSIGQIHKFGLLKNCEGNPYTSKGSVSRAIVLYGISFTKKMTPWGESKLVSVKDIEKFNKKNHDRFIK